MSYIVLINICFYCFSLVLIFEFLSFMFCYNNFRDFHMSPKKQNTVKLANHL